MIQILKYLAVISAAALSVFAVYAKDVAPGRPVATQTLQKRPDAPFLKIDESVLPELSESRAFTGVARVPSENVGKTKLFDPPSKQDYSF